VGTVYPQHAHTHIHAYSSYIGTFFLLLRGKNKIKKRPGYIWNRPFWPWITNPVAAQRQLIHPGSWRQHSSGELFFCRIIFFVSNSFPGRLRRIHLWILSWKENNGGHTEGNRYIGKMNRRCDTCLLSRARRREMLNIIHALLNVYNNVSDGYDDWLIRRATSLFYSWNKSI
jgi:hypothetical protein